ncbi:hypothetical protein BH23ACT2_BH23ACT2_29950 [soil metagenome]
MNPTDHPDTAPVAYEVDGRLATPTEARPVLGAVVHLGDPEIVAAEIIEAGGADFGRTTAAWLLLLAEEVGQ